MVLTVGRKTPLLCWPAKNYIQVKILFFHLLYVKIFKSFSHLDFPSYRTDLAIHPLSVILLYSILLNSPCCKYSSTIVQYLVSVIIYISNCVLSKLPNIFTVVHSNIYDPFPLIITQLCIDNYILPTKRGYKITYILYRASWLVNRTVWPGAKCA